MFMKECKKKKILNLTCKQRLFFEKSKESGEFKEMYKKKKNGVIKTKNGNEFKRFRNVLELV